MLSPPLGHRDRPGSSADSWDRPGGTLRGNFFGRPSAAVTLRLLITAAGIPSHKSTGDPPPKRSRPPYRCSRTDILLMSGCWDIRYCWGRRYDNSGSRQTAAEGGPFASVGIYNMTSIRNLCLYRTDNLYVKPNIYSFTKNVYFRYMP